MSGLIRLYSLNVLLLLRFIFLRKVLFPREYTICYSTKSVSRHFKRTKRFVPRRMCRDGSYVLARQKEVRVIPLLIWVLCVSSCCGLPLPPPTCWGDVTQVAR